MMVPPWQSSFSLKTTLWQITSIAIENSFVPKAQFCLKFYWEKTCCWTHGCSWCFVIFIVHSPCITCIHLLYYWLWTGVSFELPKPAYRRSQSLRVCHWTCSQVDKMSIKSWYRNKKTVDQKWWKVVKHVVQKRLAKSWKILDHP